MAGNAARRARRQAVEAGDVDLPDEEELEELAELDEVPATRRSGPGIGSRFVAWVDQEGKEGSSMRMQGRDALGSYLASIVLVLIPFVFIVANATHHGTPKLASPIYQAAGLILGLLTALSVRLENRILTPLAAIVSVLLTGVQLNAVPDSLRYLSEVDLIVGMAVVVVLSLRQSRARGVQTGERRAAKGSAGARAARPAGRRGKKDEPEPTGPGASRRYTPPKNRSSA